MCPVAVDPISSVALGEATRHICLATTMQRSPPLATILICAAYVVIGCADWQLSAQTPSTCKVTCNDHDGANSIGSGVLIVHGGGPADGISLVATAAHIVRYARRISVVFEGRNQPLQCKLVGYEPTDDVAILAVATPTNIDANGICHDVSGGDRVVREGYPRAGKLRAVRTVIDRIAGRYYNRSHLLVNVRGGAIGGESGGPVYSDHGGVVALTATTNRNVSSGPSGKAILAAMPHQSWRTSALCAT